MTIKLKIALFVAVIAIGQCTNIFDLFNLANQKELRSYAIEVPELRDDQPNRNCMCKGPACICCVDFNMTIVDLGGPGCVHMKYVSPEDGFSVQISYGKKLIHNSKIRGANPPPICLEVFGKLAQICAKFYDLAPTSDGLRGCIELQPVLIGVTQLEFPVGCFKSTDGGMEMEDPPAEPVSTTEGAEEEEGEEESDPNDSKDTFDPESFLFNIYKTAEEGVSFLSSLLDIPRNGTVITTTTTTPKPEGTIPERLARILKHKHPNQL